MITIAIPFYNVESYLELSIKSVLIQTYQDWKLILVDDGSTDNSLSIAKKFEKLDGRIKVVSDGQNRNLAFRLNQIPTLIDTKYLARMDADDIMCPDRIEKQLHILEKETNIDVLGTNAYSINEQNIIVGVKQPITTGLSPVKSFIHPTIMAKTDWFLKNPYDVKAIRCEDAELWSRTWKQNAFFSINEPLLYYRESYKDYYKKYFKSLEGLKYITSKKYKYDKKDGIKFFFSRYLKQLLVGSLYYSASGLGMENHLARIRNINIAKNKKIDVAESLFSGGQL